MNKRFLIVITCLILLLSLSITILGIKYKNSDESNVESLLLKDKLNSSSAETVLMSGFEANEYLTVGQLLVFYSRILGKDVASVEEAKIICNETSICLPSDLVYDITAWENLWRDIATGKVVFEKTNDNTYAINLIQGYLKIYLNQQGYDLLKKGLIPPQLYFYSAFSTVGDLEEINLNKNASLGFVLDVLMSIDVKENKKEIIKEIITDKVISITGKAKSQWTDAEVSLYNYYALSYFGEFEYFRLKGYLEGIEFNNIMNNVSEGEFLILYQKITDEKS